MPSDRNQLIFFFASAAFSVALRNLMPEYRPFSAIVLLLSVAGILYAVRSLYFLMLMGLYRKVEVWWPWGAPIAARLGVVMVITLYFGGGWWLLKGRSLEVIGIAPVDVFSRHRFTIGGQDLESVDRGISFESIDHGISFVLRVRNGDQVSFINGVNLVGKLHLNSNELLRFIDSKNVTGMSMTTWGALMKKHPYIVVSWSGGPLSNTESIKLEPGEESFIKLTVHEVGKAVPGYLSPRSNYLGYDDGDQVPAWMIEAADPDMCFPGTGGVVLRQFAVDIHNNFRNGAAQIILRIGSLSVPIEPSKIQTIRRVEKKDWEEGSAQEIYFGNSYYKSPKDIAPYSPSLVR